MGPAPSARILMEDTGGDFVTVHQQRLLGCMAPVGSCGGSKDKACFHECVQGRPFRGGCAGPRLRLRRQVEPGVRRDRDGHVEEPRLGKGSASPAPGARHKLMEAL